MGFFPDHCHYKNYYHLIIKNKVIIITEYTCISVARLKTTFAFSFQLSTYNLQHVPLILLLQKYTTPAQNKPRPAPAPISPPKKLSCLLPAQISYYYDTFTSTIVLQFWRTILIRRNHTNTTYFLRKCHKKYTKIFVILLLLYNARKQFR